MKLSGRVALVLAFLLPTIAVNGAALEGKPAEPTPSPVVSLGGQCGGLTYKGPTGCEQIKGKDPIACVIVNPYFWQCQFVSPTLTTVTLDPPKPTCLTSTLACSASCKMLCPKGQHMTGTSCPFCVCETPTPLCSATPSVPTITPTTITLPTITTKPTPTTTTSNSVTCVSSTVSCNTMCAIGCPPGMVNTGTRCPFCSCQKPTPLCTSTPTPTVTPTLTTITLPTITTNPTATTSTTQTVSCVSSTVSCSIACEIGCPSGMIVTGTKCPFCSCAKPTPLCTSTPGIPTFTTTTLTLPTLTPTPTTTSTSETVTCVSSTLSCATQCLIGCPSGMTVTGTKCPFCSCAKPTPLCTSTGSVDIPLPTITPL